MFSRIFGKEGAMYLIYVVLFVVRAPSHPPCLARPPRGGIYEEPCGGPCESV
jgi:hypothetical protein